MIEMNDNTYILGLWYSNDPRTGNNWLCFIERDDSPDGDWKGVYRFRYKRDEKIFNSKDEKSWMTIEGRKNKSIPKMTEDQMIEYMDKFQLQLSGGYPDMDKMIVRDGLKDFLEKAKEKDWMNLRVEEIEKEKK